MANVDNPSGFQFLRTIHGNAPLILTFPKLASYGTAIFRQDSVAQVAGDATSGPIINAFTTAIANVSGVAINYGAASTLTTHSVIVDPNTIFVAQDNNATDGLTAANNGLNADVEANAGSTTTLLSGHEINETGVAVTATLDLKLVRLHNSPNNAYGSWSRWEVMFNNHRFGLAVVGV